MILQHTKPMQTQDEDELSLVDIIRFFSRNRKFLMLTTAGLSAIAIILSALQPKQYQKQLTLSVKAIPLPLSQPTLGLDANQLSARSVESLKDRSREDRSREQSGSNSRDNVAKMIARPRYDPVNQRLDVGLRSSDKGLLKAAGPQVISQIKSEFQDLLGETIETNITSIEFQIARNQRALGKLEEQISKLRLPNLSSSQELRTVPRLEALETQRVNYITAISNLEFDKEYLEQAQKNLDEFASQAISVQVLIESDIQQPRSLIQVAVVAVIASFFVAVFAAVIRELMGRLIDELPQGKPQPSKEV